jgi:hypothetical protein
VASSINFRSAHHRRYHGGPYGRAPSRTGVRTSLRSSKHHLIRSSAASNDRPYAHERQHLRTSTRLIAERSIVTHGPTSSDLASCVSRHARRYPLVARARTGAPRRPSALVRVEGRRARSPSRIPRGAPLSAPRVIARPHRLSSRVVADHERDLRAAAEACRPFESREVSLAVAPWQAGHRGRHGPRRVP